MLGKKVGLICEVKQREIRSGSKRKGSSRRMLGSKDEKTQWKIIGLQKKQVL